VNWAGDYLIVGVHDDSSVKSYMGEDYPIMTLNERVMSVLACKYVDEVILGVPLQLTAEIVEEFKVTTLIESSLGWKADYIYGTRKVQDPAQGRSGL